jgi:outer membrane protein OmpA-like peptidoglycan-associated protein
VAGIAGNAGPSGFQGERGATGPTGEQGAVGIVERWTPYRQFGFNREGSNLSAAEMDRISDMAAYLVRNPSLEVGIDGSMDARRFSRSDRDLSDRRADSIRDALMQAGVPGYKIQMGAFADPDLRREGQIQVLIKTRG